jgi:hypothetical protein
MPQDAMTLAMLRMRDEHDVARRQERLDEIGAEVKPPPNTVMTITEVGMLIQVHHYEECEQVGIIKVGDDRGMGYQPLVHENGQVVIQAGWAPVMKGRHARPRRVPQRAWTAQKTGPRSIPVK